MMVMCWGDGRRGYVVLQIWCDVQVLKPWYGDIVPEQTSIIQWDMYQSATTAPVRVVSVLIPTSIQCVCSVNLLRFCNVQ